MNRFFRLWNTLLVVHFFITITLAIDWLLFIGITSTTFGFLIGVYGAAATIVSGSVRLRQLLPAEWLPRNVNVYVVKESQAAGTVFKVTVENFRNREIVIQDVRLMISEPYGIPFNHRTDLNVKVDSGKNAKFEFTEASVSSLLRRLYHPREYVTVPHTHRRVWPRCILGTKESFVGKSTVVSTDSECGEETAISINALA